VAVLSLIEHCTCVADWWSVASVPNVPLSPAHSLLAAFGTAKRGVGGGQWNVSICGLEFDVSSDTFQFLNTTFDRLHSLSLDALALRVCSRLSAHKYSSAFSLEVLGQLFPRKKGSNRSAATPVASVKSS